MLQIAVDTLESVVHAINAGADELELSTYLSDGGLTPTVGFVREVQRLMMNLPAEYRPKINVMIRTRAGDDFMYTKFEMMTMLHDVEIFRDMGVDGFVFGALTDDRDVDQLKCMQVLAVASPRPVAFSRAFDHVREFKRNVSLIVGLGFYRVVSSGLRCSLNKPGAIKNISFLATRYDRDELSVMPAGVSTDNVGIFINVGCDIVQASCRSAVKIPEPESTLSLGVTDHTTVFLGDFELMLELKECIMHDLQERDRDQDVESY